jgi:hypothetical protein
MPKFVIPKEIKFLITENLIKSRNELMNAYEGLFLSELYNSENDG